MKSIVEVITLCGRQNLALRGHREDKSALNESSAFNHGNFLALLSHRAAAGDDVLKAHLETCKGNASYMSPTIQNELIGICGKIILVRLLFPAESKE